ncbi:hypothetical protein MNBD_GAMMA26-2 [hydrothermal vent metagenome]|uniref:DUF354 domain-containing protein n=1 Tax=hydrothermal vent metagenome TaxID=652676 RepID=A0A3B1ATI9_9ZZZZ
MRILIDIGHPAHVHFFHQPIKQLQADGHQVIITSRDKEFALELLDGLGLEHHSLSALGKGGMLDLAKELVCRDLALLKVVRKTKPDMMAAIGGVFIAHVGRLTGVPSLVFYDTENATMQNAITYPLASAVIVPNCYHGWLPKKRHLRYSGYHELSYLHPDYFTPNRETAIVNGLNREGNTFFLRLVSWQANHDVGENGWSEALLEKLINKLKPLGKILISSEAPLSPTMKPYRYQGDINQVHHVMAFSALFIGESATMSSECAVLGVPAIYAAETGRGYTTEQEQKFGLVKNLHTIEWSLLEATIDEQLAQPASHWPQARQQLLDETIDVARFVTQCITTFPEPLQHYQANLES